MPLARGLTVPAPADATLPSLWRWAKAIAQLVGQIYSRLVLSIDGDYGDNVASAAALRPSGKRFHVTGTTNITSIVGTDLPPGYEITIIFDGVLTVTDGSNLKLAGNFVTSADDTMRLVWDGANWFELSRSAN